MSMYILDIGLSNYCVCFVSQRSYISVSVGFIFIYKCPLFIDKKLETERGLEIRPKSNSF